MRICSGAGCLRAVDDLARFCDECRPAQTVVCDLRNHTSGYDAEIDRLNKSARWQRLRARVLKRFPLCRVCERDLSAIVDHIVPAREVISQAQLSGLFVTDKYAGYFLVTNLQGLCRSCHWVKTNEDKMHVGPWPDAVAVEVATPKRRFSF